MADGEIPSPEVAGAPKGPETLGDPTLIEAEELLKRIDEQEENQTSPDNNIILKAVESSLTKINGKIAKEQAKTPPNYKDLKRMSKVQTGLMERKAAIIARADKTADKKTTKVIEDLTGASDESTVRLEEMRKLQKQKVSLEAQLGAEPLKSSDKPEDAAKRTEIFGTLSEVTTRLEKLEQKGTYEEQEKVRDAQIAKRKEAEAMRAKEDGEAAERIIADLEGSEGESSTEEPDTDQNPEEDKDKPKSTSSEGEEEKAERKKELLHNALHKVAYGLAVDLEKNYPGVDGNAYEKMEWNGKAFLLKIVVMFGGTPKWAELVKDNPTLSEFLEKKVGMTFAQEDIKKEGVATGEKRWAVKWEKPVEGWEPGIVEMADVFETAYGDTDKAAKAMKGIKPETTLAELEATAPQGDNSEAAVSTRKLVKAMRDADPNIIGETKVQEFLTNTQNAKKVQTLLNPPEGTAGAEVPRELSQLLKDLDKIPPLSPEAIREHAVRDLLPALTDSTLTFTADMPLIDAWAAMLKPANLSAEKEAKWAADIVLFKNMASGEGASLSKDMLEKVKDNPYQGELLATSLVVVDAMSAEEAHAIIRDAADGSLDESSLASLATSTDKMLINFAQAFDRKTLGQALDGFKPKDEDEKAKVEAAKKQISGDTKEREASKTTVENGEKLKLTATTFPIEASDFSAKQLEEWGVSFSRNSLLDWNGKTIKKFGPEVKGIRIGDLGDGRMFLQANLEPGELSSRSTIYTDFKTREELISLFPEEAAQT